MSKCEDCTAVRKLIIHNDAKAKDWESGSSWSGVGSCNSSTRLFPLPPLKRAANKNKICAKMCRKVSENIKHASQQSGYPDPRISQHPLRLIFQEGKGSAAAEWLRRESFRCWPLLQSPDSSYA